MAMVLFDNTPLPNLYDFSIEFSGDGLDTRAEMIAFDRIKHILNTQMTAAIFADVNNPLIKNIQKNFNAYVITLPTQPIDMIIGPILFSKLISAVEGKLDIKGISISSTLGDDISTYISDEDLGSMTWMLDDKVKEITGNPAWYYRTDAGCTDIIIQNKNGFTVEHDKEDWEEHGLGWEEVKSKIDDQPATIVKFPDKRWKPKIIDGGLDDKG